MDTNLNIPDELWSWAQAMVNDGFCASTDQYIAELLREDQARVLKAMRRAEGEEGAEPMTPELFQRIRSTAQERAGEGRPVM